MKGIEIEFKNRPNEDGTLSTFTIDDCLVAPTGSPAAKRPQLTVHLPKTSKRKVVGAWFIFEGDMYHVVGMTPASMAENTPTRWNRYAIAEKIY